MLNSWASKSAFQTLTQCSTKFQEWEVSHECHQTLLRWRLQFVWNHLSWVTRIRSMLSAKSFWWRPETTFEWQNSQSRIFDTEEKRGWNKTVNVRRSSVRNFTAYFGRHSESSNRDKYSKNFSHSTVTSSHDVFRVLWICGCSISSIW